MNGKPPNAYFDRPHVVTVDEIDGQGHVHNLRYLQWSLWAAGGHTAELGLDAAGESERGFGFVVRRHEVEYRRAAFLGDSIVVRTWISQIDSHSSWRRSVIVRPKHRDVLARVDTRWVYVDLKRHRLAEIPPVVADAAVVLNDPPSMPWA